MSIRLTKKRRAILTICLVVLYIIPTVWVAIVAFNYPVWKINPAPQPESFALLIPLLMTPGRPFQDILLGVNVTYTTAIVVNDPIKLHATAQLSSPTSLSVTALSVFFQDALHWPPSSSYFDIPFPGQLVLTVSSTLPRILTGNATVYWNHVGTFSPRIIASLDGGSARFDFGLISYETIQVLSRETLTEIQTNRVNLVLTNAIFILTALGLAGTVIELWIVEPSKPR